MGAYRAPVGDGGPRLAGSRGVVLPSSGTAADAAAQTGFGSRGQPGKLRAPPAPAPRTSMDATESNLRHPFLYRSAATRLRRPQELIWPPDGHR